MKVKRIQVFSLFGHWNTFMLRLDVCFERLGIVLGSMSNTQDIDIEIKCQYFCLDVLDIQNSD